MYALAMDAGAYNISLDPFFKPLEVMNVAALAASKEPWWNQTLCQVNDSVVRLGVVNGEFHWHKHDEEDEFFYCLEGKFIIELEHQTVELTPGKGFLIPKGVMHCPRAPERTVILMVEGPGVVPTGD